VGGEVSFDEGGARIRLSFDIPASSQPSRQLTITSDVPKRVSRGHRELLMVRVGGRAVAETLLDVERDSASVDLGAPPSKARIAWIFLAQGVRHILSGYDHLVFLAGLLLAVCAGPAFARGFGAAGPPFARGFGAASRDLAVALTAFTAAHSVSLALVVIGGVRAPGPVVEPLIAASIAWIGVENLFPARKRNHWLVVFGFGLIHGFGLAGSLMELASGRAAADVALALVSFNAGVEAGQLAAAGAMLAIFWIVRSRLAILLPLCSVLIALAGGYWLIARLP
jgi:hypothetical protein